jgi:hypothetical protein
LSVFHSVNVVLRSSTAGMPSVYPGFAAVVAGIALSWPSIR